MLRQIEKLQKRVNYLLGLCRQAGAHPDADAFSNESVDPKFERLGVMLLKWQDGVLSNRSIDKLNQWLAHDQEARRYYVEFQQLTVALHMHFNPGRFAAPPIMHESHV